MKLSKGLFGGMQAYYRAGKPDDPSSDQQALAEVLERRSYRRPRSGFDVKTGERWLDLGANIGAFALYAQSCGAREVVCYEPDQECFEILVKNTSVNKMASTKFLLHNAAVTAIRAKKVSFKTSDNPTNRYRGTVMAENVHVPDRYVACPPVNNVYAGRLMDDEFDGIKMDIEGSEGPLFDNGLLPDCGKLVLEYHTSRDANVERLYNRLQFLKGRFEHVLYPKAFDDAIDRCSGPDEVYRPRFDQLIFAWEPR
jgi:FkbM family methyltransferase